MFIKEFEKTAAIAAAAKKLWHNPKALDKAGLGVLGGVAAYHGAKAIKEKDPGSAAAAGADMAGLGLLYRAVNKGH